MGAAANERLVDAGMSVMGIDQWGLDAPFQYQIANPSSNAIGAPFGGAPRLPAHALLAHGASFPAFPEASARVPRFPAFPY